MLIYIHPDFPLSLASLRRRLPLPLLRCLHLPPRRQNHLLPPPLQIRLPLVPIRTPRLRFGLLFLDFLDLAQLGGQIVPRYQIWFTRLRRARCSGGGSRRAACRGRGDCERWGRLA
jgi:hypothetical protein